MLKLNDVEVEIEGVQVLRNLNFSLSPGKTTVMIGRNGAGKTTTLRTIMGLLPQARGKITLGSEPIESLPAYKRAFLGIGYSPEDRRLIPHFSVEDNILLPCLALKMSPQEQKDKLEEVYELLPELYEMRSRPGGGTSGGQGKMVALGRALMVSEKVLMLDEPYQGLAPALALNYSRTLAKLRKNKPDIAMLITESSPQLLDEIADETLRIERGGVEAA